MRGHMHRRRETLPKHLLVCVDVDQEGGWLTELAVVERAAEITCAFGARMTVFAVVNPLSMPSPPLGGESEAHWRHADRYNAERERCSRMLTRLVDSVRNIGISVGYRLFETNDNPVDVIHVASSDLGADMLVIGSTSKLDLVGSGLAGRSTVPVLVAPCVCTQDPPRTEQRSGH